MGESLLDGEYDQSTSQEYKPIRFTVESDWSAASYWYEIMALSKNAEIELLGLFKNSLQGDAAGRSCSLNWEWALLIRNVESC